MVEIFPYWLEMVTLVMEVKLLFEVALPLKVNEVAIFSYQLAHPPIPYLAQFNFWLAKVWLVVIFV
jgi:hypothetical protein